ncbi:hypothetical protein NX779_03135 [Mycoplasma cottewii]|uniref:Uncharacterized protein n=1 Tax=Mycoplasma cottewii TaxID=51364 RepID=A0ABY5TW60_9MOLU|nr:hypothetical protein [Mycoplasma cottewii]UWD34785.1 hypothetical protein NX779_03135 [Mycoplasma cottewii]
MKKLLLPIIGSLIVGSALTGGSVYAVKTIRHNAEVDRIRTLFQNEASAAKKLIGDVTKHLTAIKNNNNLINNELNRINTQGKTILNDAKEVYKKAVSLSFYKVKDHDDKDVTYYLAYYKSDDNDIEATKKETTKLESSKKELVIPDSWENLLNTGIKAQVKVQKEDGQEKDEIKVIKTGEFNNMKLFDQNLVIDQVVKKILEQVKIGGEKLVEFFQKKLNELTKLLDDLKILDNEGLFKILVDRDPSLKDKFKDWQKMETKKKLETIKSILTSLKSEWDHLSSGVKDAIGELYTIEQTLNDILTRAQNDGAQSQSQPPAGTQ